ncbi:MAG: VOC family protein [Treponema sp.]|jgi:PhnB protein|nr:VOC family protein [Treponema sp.]
MSLDAFLCFDGDCRKALEFYAEAFNQKMPDQIMTYGQAPEGSPGIDNDRIIYACMPVFGQNLMFCDCPNGAAYSRGNNIMLTIGLGDVKEMKRIFEALSKDGEVCMPLEKTFFSELFGQVTDRFGIIWQLSKTPV